ncbi:hypothetical protein ETH_00042170, partial [Eimeria tenella]
GLLDRLHLENLEFNAARLTDELRRHQIPVVVTGGGVAVADTRLYLTHARLDIIAENCELRLAPKGFADASEGNLAEVAERQLQEVNTHIRQFYSLQKQQELQLRLQRLDRLLNEHLKEAAARKEFEAEAREVLQQQQA